MFKQLPHRQILAFLILFLFAQVSGYLIVTAYYQQTKTTYLAWTSQKLAQEYETVTTLYRIFFATFFEQHVNDIVVKNTLEQAQQADSQRKELLRQALLQRFNPVYENLKRVGIRQFQVHLPGNIVLVRMHRPDFFGDDLTKIRETVAYVDQHHIAAEGFEQGRTFTGIRFVYPLFNDAGNFIGSAELSTSIEVMVRSLSHIYPHLQLLVNKEITDAKVKPDEKGKYSPSPYAANLLIESTTSDKPLDMNLDKAILDNIAKRSLKNEDFSFPVRSLNNKLGVVSFLSLRNTLTGKSVGYLVSHSDSAHLQEIEDSYQRRLLTSFIATGLIIVAFIVVFLQKKTLIKRYYHSKIMDTPNRQALLRDLKHIKTPSVALININEFKNINDIYGVEMGNHLLEKFGAQVKHYTTEKGYSLYHLGADELAIIGINENNSSLVNDMTQLQYQLEHHVYQFEDSEIEIELDIAIGIAHRQNQALEKADLALREAKSSHQDLVVYDEEMALLDMHFKNLSVFRNIRRALKDNDILSYYQPIVNEQGNILKYEALVRMRDGDEILTPYHFLDVAIRTRYYHDITRIMLKNAFELLDQNPQQSVSVNILVDDILNNATVAYIMSLLDTGRYNKRIVFEIVESQSIQGIPEVMVFINEIKQKGALIAIDDFGSGYSNFSYISTLQPDYLKIDGSLIKDLPSNVDAQKIVRTIILFAQQLQIKTIAEFVHSEEVLQWAIKLGIDEFQGFHTGKPQPIENAASAAA